MSCVEADQVKVIVFRGKEVKLMETKLVELELESRVGGQYIFVRIFFTILGVSDKYWPPD